MRLDVIRGALFAIVFVLLLELGASLSAQSDLFRIDYFVKGGFLGLLLAAVSTLYFGGALLKKNWMQIWLTIIMFICAVLSMILSYKFILVGFIISMVASTLCYRGNRDAFSIGCIAFSLVMVAYVYYIEFIDIGQQVLFNI